ncbi:MAG: DeoR/GlpR transcriptional regulator [Ruminococcaceae bacterium]|nr:DeoR/GlpR transcriptional regulator [Oscillospiraceae bacterium]
MKSFRIKQMEQYIMERRTVTMEELCQHFQVSMNTVRQDVASLVEKGTVKKIYGGVTSVEKSPLLPFEQRRQRNADGKRAIGRLAAAFVEDRDIIFLDSGTTTMHILEFIEPDKQVTMVTYSLIAINAAEAHSNVEVICLPGKLERMTRSFTSADTIKALERLHINKSFMATTGISATGDVTNSSLLEHDIKRAAVARSKKNYLLMDGYKFGRPSLVTYTDISRMDGLITDEGPSADLTELCRRKSVALWAATPQESPQVLSENS